jgi:hypothetical protein
VLHDVGTLKASSGKRLNAPLTGIDTPTLKGVWGTAPYLHDGSAPTLADVFTTANPFERHGAISGLSQVEIDQLVTYLQQIDDEEPPPAPRPIITAMTPGTGAPGDLIEISGEHLANVTQVAFNGVVSDELVPVSSALIRARVPSAATTGRIRVHTFGGATLSAQEFIVEVSNPEIVFNGSTPGVASAAATVSTTTAVRLVAGDLYLAVISMKASRSVSSVTGMGATWTRVAAQCGGRSQTGVEIWQASGPVASGPVQATLVSRAENAVISVCRYSGVSASAPIGALVRGNTNGVSGGCTNGTDGARYAFELTSTAPGSVIFSAAAIRQHAHTPGGGFQELLEIHHGTTAAAQAGLAIQERTLPIAQQIGGKMQLGPVSVAGTLASSTDWAVIALEFKRAGPRSPVGFASKDSAGDLVASRSTMGLPVRLELSSGYPNPFRRATTLEYGLPRDERMRVTIYDARGRHVRTLVDNLETAGFRRISWDGTNSSGRPVASGVYFVRLVAGDQSLTRKVLFMK